jgi:hypothetical protein
MRTVVDANVFMALATREARVASPVTFLRGRHVQDSR